MYIIRLVAARPISSSNRMPSGILDHDVCMLWVYVGLGATASVVFKLLVGLYLEPIGFMVILFYLNPNTVKV